LAANNFLCKYSIKQLKHAWKHSFPEIHEVNLRTLMERHVITFRKQLINLLYQPDWAIPVKLVEINMIPLINLNRTIRFITGKFFSFIIHKYSRIECILLKFHWGMKALTEVHFQWSAVVLHVENVARSTLSYPNETSKECIQFL
jgi:hypothetical protein